MVASHVPPPSGGETRNTRSRETALRGRQISEGSARFASPAGRRVVRNRHPMCGDLTRLRSSAMPRRRAEKSERSGPRPRNQRAYGSAVRGLAPNRRSQETLDRMLWVIAVAMRAATANGCPPSPDRVPKPVPEPPHRLSPFPWLRFGHELRILAPPGWRDTRRDPVPGRRPARRCGQEVALADTVQPNVPTCQRAFSVYDPPDTARLRHRCGRLPDTKWE